MIESWDLMRKKRHTNTVRSTMHVGQSFFRCILTGPNQFWAQGPYRLKCGPDSSSRITYH